MNQATRLDTEALRMTDIEGQPVRPGNGRKLLLSLFREATCPFCNFRVYELTQHYPHLTRHGLDIVTVFSSPEDEVNRFIARRPRPFRMVADPLAEAHRRFAARSSLWGKMRAMLLRPLALLFGMREVGMRAMVTNNLLPADLLIDEQGRVVDAYYGQDAGDHMPMERIEAFIQSSGNQATAA